MVSGPERRNVMMGILAMEMDVPASVGLRLGFSVGTIMLA